jgi:putative ABC transport system ATP-binding protein
LTIVLNAKDNIPGIVHAGGDTVGLRCPDHPLTLELLAQSKLPLDAPSANPSAEESPKTAAKVLEATTHIVEKNKLTTLMITHNMRDAIAYGNRLIMMCDGRIVVDVSGEEKKKLTVPQLLEMFSQASGSDEADDKLLLS